MDLQEEFPNYPRRDELELEEPYSRWHLSVYADYGGSYLWDMNGCCAGCEEFGAPSTLDERFRTWSNKYEVIFERRHETGDYTQHHLPLAEAEALYEEGLQLCAEFAVFLESKCKTLDYRALSKPTERFVMANPPTTKSPTS
jgi:hypothetical protein